MSGRKSAKPGRTRSLGPPLGEAWTWQTNVLLGSITYRALGIGARQTLDFLRYEHACHAGRENGNLAAPYRQLEQWGVTPSDIPRALAELSATGFALRTYRGMRQAGGGEPSRYALTWYPTMAASADEVPPTHEWIGVIEYLNKQGIGTVRQVRAWLRAEVVDAQRGHTKNRRATPQLRATSPLICEAKKGH